MYTLVLRSGTVMTMPDSSAQALIQQIGNALLRSAACSIMDGVLVRPEDVLLLAPSNAVEAVTAPAVRLSANVTTKPMAKRVGS